MEMYQMPKRFLLIAALFLPLQFVDVVIAREITDMAERTVEVPDRVERVFASSPPVNVLLHAVAPKQMISLSFNIAEAAKKFYTSPHLQSLPVTGGAFGFGKSMNPETVLALRPDIALAWYPPMISRSKTEKEFQRIGIPVVFLRLDLLSDWPVAMRFTGKLLGLSAETEPKAQYIERALTRLSDLIGSVPEDQRPRVYYAEGTDGLATDCHHSLHAEAIELAGGYNVYRCEPKNHKGLERISIEQVLAFDPDIIIVQDLTALESLRNDARWQAVRAVRANHIHTVPRWPHNWLDRPPSFMRALGAQWLANLFYPDRYPLDLKQEIRDFYRLFFDVALSDAEIDDLLNP
jgi:iron complex transport system substrate-binding protein